ncbi:MAG: FAD-dependent oxidoreductase [Deltaproteobacteria bacterium]|nr:FAD-dependent oxidoreductase [Deltaproteobacteria bacterium]
MYAIKEALVAKEKSHGQLETVIFYMDMRTFGKSYQRYRDEAEKGHNVRFERGRVHSIIVDDSNDATGGDLSVRYVDSAGAVHEERFDMAVLSVGQRPVPGTEKMAEMLDISLNPWGFCHTEPFSLTRTNQEGILVGGAYSGLKDIGDSVIQASAAALSASRVIHSAGGGLAPESLPVPGQTDLMRELPRILIVICTCGDALSPFFNRQRLASRLESDPVVSGIEFIERTCTASGWEALIGLIEKHKPNRVLIGACLPYIYARKIRELCRQFDLDSSLMDVVDIRSSALPAPDPEKEADPKHIVSTMTSALLTGLARLKRVNPAPVSTVRVQQQALVVGGGIAGMTAALAIADHGFQVNLIEQEERLGGNLTWLPSTLEGHSVKTILDDTLMKIEKHPLVQVHTRTRVAGSYGQVGHFYTSIEEEEGSTSTLEHGVVVIATGGTEATTSSFDYDKSDAIITQRELTQKLDDHTIDPGQMESVVMIQCVDSRQEPRNYCSRVCCASALKHALYLKEENPEIAIYVLYRDIMSYGFTETYYTRARQAGVIFLQYDVEEKPEVIVPGDSDSAGKPVQVNAYDPILGRDVQIAADLVVLATGIAPNMQPDLAGSFGADLDQDGFFQEAESKWRPVDSLKEGVFACGLALSPRSVAEAIATAEAAAQRSLRILSQKNLPSGKVVATVHHSLCSLCERCIDVCPYSARILDSESDQILVNPVMCQGCGSCAAVCPNGASVLEGFPEEQMFECIDAALEGTFD